MTGSDLMAILPLLILTATSLLVLLGIAARRNINFSFWTALAGTALALLSVALSLNYPGPVGILLTVDGLSIFFAVLLLFAAAAVLLFARSYSGWGHIPADEFYLLIVLAALGAVSLTWSAHFATLFISLEILSVSLYALIAYPRDKESCLEAGIKYLGLASVSSSFLLFGLALLFAATGSMDISAVSHRIAGLAADDSLSPLAVSGLALTLSGLAFKLALAPFHMWAPDVYEGSPAPATAFIATVSKGAVIGVLFRIFSGYGLQDQVPVFGFFTVLSVLSMFVGNLLALYQDNVKRLLACSSIAHMGYILVALLAAGAMRFQAAAFYLVIYFIMTLGCFGVITVLTNSSLREPDTIADFKGLFQRQRGLAVLFTLMVLSLAGMPVTAGFFAKFYLVAAGVGSSLWLLVIMLILNSGIGLFYYLRLITAIFSAPETAPISVPLQNRNEGRIVLGVLLILLIWWGLYPAPLLEWIARISIGPEAGF